jgi:uncharacterized protein (DUF2236 family)
MTAPSHDVSAEDLDRLRTACGHQRIDLRRSLYGAASVTWRVNREAVLLVGGGRALLLQVAHPLVAAGVARHSNFRNQPLQRLWRTLDLMLTISFGSATQAIRAVRAIERVHGGVHGNLRRAAGPFARGTPYHANDPALLVWVYATLVDAALLVYERFVAPLPADAKLAYYNESKVGMRLFGIPEQLIPHDLDDFRAYVREMIAGRRLAVSADSREIAASILDPPLPLGVRQAFQMANLFTIGLLPPVMRKRYGFTWSASQETALEAIATAARRFVRFLPSLVRSFPHAQRLRAPNASAAHHPALSTQH